MRKFSKRTMIVAAASATALTAGGIAYAWYAAGVAGTGTGSATPAANTAANVTFAAAAITGLVPGGSAVPATVTVHNPNPYSVHITSHPVSVTSASGTGCTSAQAQLSGSGTMPAQTIAASSDGPTTFTVNVSMADDPTMDQSSCAGTPLTVTYTAS
jgi:hypothetical protein